MLAHDQNLIEEISTAADLASGTVAARIIDSLGIGVGTVKIREINGGIIRALGDAENAVDLGAIAIVDILQHQNKVCGVGADIQNIICGDIFPIGAAGADSAWRSLLCQAAALDMENHAGIAGAIGVIRAVIGEAEIAFRDAVHLHGLDRGLYAFHIAQHLADFYALLLDPAGLIDIGAGAAEYCGQKTDQDNSN